MNWMVYQQEKEQFLLALNMPIFKVKKAISTYPQACAEIHPKSVGARV